MDSMHFGQHPRFDLQPQGSILARNVSTRSCPPRTSPPSHLREDEDGGNDQGEHKPSGTKPTKKKCMRRHTDDASKECFTLKFDLNVDIDTEIVPAMKKRTLREVLGPVFERKGIELSRVDLFLDQSNTPLSLNFEAYHFGSRYLKVKARPGDELKVEQGVKDLRSLSLPIMKPSAGQGPFIVAPVNERVEHGSLGRREAVDLLGQVHRRKNMTVFLGVDSIPSPDSLAHMGGSLPVTSSAVPLGPEVRKNRASSRFSVLFSSSTGTSKELDRAEQLQNKLHYYSAFGMPKVPPPISFNKDSWEEEGEPNLVLEDSWQQLLDSPESLSRRQFHQQEAIWELLQTEATYIKKLRVITDLFLCCLLNLQESRLLLEVDPWRLFNNIQDIVRLHTALWAEVMLPALEKAREGRTLLDPTHLQEGFRTIDVRLKPYVRYCMEEEACMEYMRNLLRENEPFRMYVTWAETHKQCNRLKLADMLVKPHQRLTKYPLLLKSVLKKTDEPGARDALAGMVASVEAFINSVDSQMRQRQEQKKLASISGRIESYEAVDGGSEEVEKILREFSHFDLMAPMKGTPPEETRQLYLEGALRMKEGKDCRMDVYCFLFTDVLLITKPTKRVEKVKVIRQPLFMQNVVCRELKDPGSFLIIYLNEFNSAVAAFTFQANSNNQGRSWIDAICNVQKKLQRLRSEEVRRQQKLAGRVEEEEGEEESGNSTTSSPSLRHKDQGDSQSDGSTETLSVVTMEDGNGDNDSLSLEASACGSAHGLLPAGVDIPSLMALQSHAGGVLLAHMDLDTQCRSMSMDSAYGTLSPESLLRELHLREQSDRGEEEEEETEGEAEEMEGDELEMEGDGPEEEDEEVTPTTSQPLASSSMKLWRKPPVQPRLRSLRNSLVKSCSEDNLLQRVQGCGEACVQGPARAPKRRTADRRQRLCHSRSLSQLCDPGCLFHVDSGRSEPSEDGTRVCGSSDVCQRSLAGEGGSGRASGSSSDSEMTPSGSPGVQRQSDGDVSGAQTSTARRPTVQQHKKLTLAQLYRIRTTLVLNSTLTASEV